MGKKVCKGRTQLWLCFKDYDSYSDVYHWSKDNILFCDRNSRKILNDIYVCWLVDQADDNIVHKSFGFQLYGWAHRLISDNGCDPFLYCCWMVINAARQAWINSRSEGFIFVQTSQLGALDLGLFISDYQRFVKLKNA